MFARTLLLKNGHIFAQGATEDMFTNEMIAELLGYPAELKRDKDGCYRLDIQTESRLGELLP